MNLYIIALHGLVAWNVDNSDENSVKAAAFNALLCYHWEKVITEND